jgi:carbon storage regulator
MLVLSRKRGESIRIGNTIVITLLENRSGESRIGIEAPRETPIYRNELYMRIMRENQKAISGEHSGWLIKSIMKK